MKQLLITLTALATLTTVACNKKAQDLVNDGTEESYTPKDEKEEYLRFKFERYFFDAKSEVIKGNLEKAIENYQSALEVYPDNDAVMFEIGKLYVELNQYEQAEQWLTKASEQAPENPWYWFELGSLYKNLGKNSEAGEVFEKGANLYKKQLTYYLDAANAYINARQYEDCIRVLDSIEVRFGLNEDFVVPKANMYIQLGNKEQGIAEVRKLVNQVPDDPHYLTLLGEMFIDLNMSDSAINVFNRILDIQPDNGDAHFYLSELYRKQGDKESYLRELELAIKDPDFEINKKLTAIYSLLPQMHIDDQTAASVERMANNFAEAHEGTPEAYTLVAEVKMSQRKYEEARDNLKKALELKSNDFNMWTQLISVDQMMKDHEATVTHCKEAIELFPNQLSLYSTACYSLLMLEKNQELIDLANEALVFSITKKDKANFYNFIGDAYDKMGDYEQADQNFEKAISLYPNDAVFMNSYAWSLAVRGAKLEKAAQLSLKTLQLNPLEPAYMDTYGWVMYKQGNYEEAEKWIKKALSIAPNEGEILEHYGDIMFKMGKVDTAVSYWQKAKENGSTSKDLDKKIANKKLYE